MKTSLRIWPALAVFAVFLSAFGASAQVFINEILASNQRAYNLDGSFPDYVELYNTNTVGVNIAGWRLSRTLNLPTDPSHTYTFPANTVVPAGGFLLIICDGETNQPLHAGFTISDGGHTNGIYLLGPSLFTRHVIRFGFQVTDHSLGHVPDGRTNTPVVLCRPTPGLPNEAVALGDQTRLKINEWMPSRDTQPDWFEIYNPEPNPVALQLLRFSDRSATPCTNKAIYPNSWLGAFGFLRFNADDKPRDDIDELDFKLSSGADQIILYSQNRSTIIHRVFWPDPTGMNGQTGAAELFISYGWLPDGNTSSPVVTFPLNRDTPEESNFLPIDNVLINEVLAHTDPPLEDAIELYNPTASAVDISGWYLSDDRDNYAKFRIPDGTVLPPNGYKVFYEYLGVPGGFNPNGQGTFPSFALSSSQGDQVYLFSVTPGTTNLNGFRRGVDFPATPNGVSYGRYIVPSTGESDFVPMKSLTFGSDVTASDPTNRLNDFRAGQGGANSEPAFGPLVISKLMYNPPDIVSGTNITDNQFDEYVEIYNMSTQTVQLYDPLFPTNRWRIRGEIEFEFPANVTLGPGRSLIVADLSLTNVIQLNNFKNKYSIPITVPVYVGYRGAMSDGGGAVEIERPDFPQQGTGFVPYLRVDRVRYDDDPPWPVDADGVKINPFAPNSLGYGLLRKRPDLYGSDPTNWVATFPTPGRQAISNVVTHVGNTVTISFDAWAGSSYTVQYRDALESGTWQKLQDFPAQSTSVTREIVTTVAPGTKRFYRTVTPMQ